MSALGAVLVALCAWLAGRALLPARAVLERDAWEEQAVAYLTGSAALVLAAMAATVCGLRFGAPLAWTLLAAAFLAGGWRVWRDWRGTERCAPCALRGWHKLLLAALGTLAVLVTISLPLNEFDPILHFALKAKVLYWHGDILDPAFTGMVGPDGAPARVGRLMTHPNYPLGVPFLEAFAAHAGGGWNDRWVLLPLAFWAVCLPAAVSFGLRGRGAAAQRWGALLAAATPGLYMRNFLQATLTGSTDEFRNAGLRGSLSLGGGGDLALAALFAGGCALLLRVRAQSCRRGAAAAGLCLAGGVMMKNEGLGLLAVLAAALLLALALHRWPAWRITALALLVAFAASAPWLVQRSRLPAIDENYSEQLSPGHVLSQLGATEPLEKTREGLTGELDAGALEHPPSRLATLARLYGLEFVDLTTWGLLWLLFVLSLPLRGGPEERWLALAALGGLALYALVLLVTPWALDQLSETGIPDRLFLHLLGPVALLLGMRLARPAAPQAVS